MTIPEVSKEVRSRSGPQTINLERLGFGSSSTASRPSGYQFRVKNLPLGANEANYAQMNQTLVEISAQLGAMSVSFDEMKNDVRDFRREAREDAQLIRKEVGEDLRAIRTDVNAVSDRLADPESGLGAMNHKLKSKPGYGFTVTTSVAIVAAIAGLVAFADTLRKLITG